MTNEHPFYNYIEDYDIDWVLDKFDNNENPWLPLINPSSYLQALTEFTKYGKLVRFPVDKIYRWMGIIMKNTVVLEHTTAINGHTDYSVEDEVIEHYFGDDADVPDVFDYFDYLESRGFDDWCVLSDGSFACTDYGLAKIYPLINQYSDDMSPEDCLVLVNKILDVYHCNGDLASAFVAGGTKALTKVSNGLSENMKKQQAIREINRILNEHIGSGLNGVSNFDGYGNGLRSYKVTNKRRKPLSKSYYDARKLVIDLENDKIDWKSAVIDHDGEILACAVTDHRSYIFDSIYILLLFDADNGCEIRLRVKDENDIRYIENIINHRNIDGSNRTALVDINDVLKIAAKLGYINSVISIDPNKNYFYGKYL